MVTPASAPYRLPMSISEIRSRVASANGLSNGVHTSVSGQGNSAELAQAIHALCQAITDLTDEVERLKHQVK